MGAKHANWWSLGCPRVSPRASVIAAVVIPVVVVVAVDLKVVPLPGRPKLIVVARDVGPGVLIEDIRWRASHFFLKEAHFFLHPVRPMHITERVTFYDGIL